MYASAALARMSGFPNISQPFYTIGANGSERNEPRSRRYRTSVVGGPRDIIGGVDFLTLGLRGPLFVFRAISVPSCALDCGAQPWVKRAAGAVGLKGVARRVAASREHVASAPVDDVFPLDAVSQGGALATAVFLQRYRGADLTWETTDTGQIARRMFAIMHGEWASEWPLVVTAAGHGLIDLGGYYRSMEDILRAGLSTARVSTLLLPEEVTPEEYARCLAALGAG